MSTLPRSQTSWNTGQSVLRNHVVSHNKRSADMAIEQQFVSFLIDRISVKLADIRKLTEAETASFVVDETQIYVDQLNQALSTILHCETPQHEESPTPVPSSNRSGSG